jgi:hypothetical protein
VLSRSTKNVHIILPEPRGLQGPPINKHQKAIKILAPWVAKSTRVNLSGLVPLPDCGPTPSFSLGMSQLGTALKGEGRGDHVLSLGGGGSKIEACVDISRRLLLSPGLNTDPGVQGPNLRTPNPGLNPGFTPRICYIKGGGNPRVKPRVWRYEIWAQMCRKYHA